MSPDNKSIVLSCVFSFLSLLSPPSLLLCLKTLLVTQIVFFFINAVITKQSENKEHFKELNHTGALMQILLLKHSMYSKEDSVQ